MILIKGQFFQNGRAVPVFLNGEAYGGNKAYGSSSDQGQNHCRELKGSNGLYRK